MSNRGKDAETRAARFLEDHGPHIIERNYRIRYGEIDLLAREGETLVFVKVRALHHTIWLPWDVRRPVALTRYCWTATTSSWNGCGTHLVRHKVMGAATCSRYVQMPTNGAKWRYGPD